jgi:hypothetical protein
MEAPANPPTRVDIGALREALEKLLRSAAALAAAISALEATAPREAPRVTIAPPGSVPSFARGIPAIVAEILSREPRHMFVDELSQRLKAQNVEVKRASISRTLSRDSRFTRYRDGWGFTVAPGASMEGASTANGNHVEVRQMWELMSPKPPYPLSLPPERKEIGHE